MSCHCETKFLISKSKFHKLKRTTKTHTHTVNIIVLLFVFFSFLDVRKIQNFIDLVIFHFDNNVHVICTQLTHSLTLISSTARRECGRCSSHSYIVHRVPTIDFSMCKIFIWIDRINSQHHSFPTRLNVFFGSHGGRAKHRKLVQSVIYW